MKLTVQAGCFSSSTGYENILHLHDTLHAAELSSDLLLAASLQQVPEDFGGAEQGLTGRVGFVHVETDRLCSSRIQY